MYEGRDSTSYPRSTTPPTDVGTYRAVMRWDKDTIAEANFRIKPLALTIIGTSATNRAYEKDNKAVTINFVRFQDENGKQRTLKLGEEYTATGTMADANAGERKNVAVVVTLISGNYTLKKNTATAKATIRKAAARTLPDVTDSQCYTLTSVSESVAGKMPDGARVLTYTAGTPSKTGSVMVSNFTVDASSRVSATLSGGKAGDTVTLPVTIGSANYEDSTVNVVITLTEKDDAGVTVSGVPAQPVTYGDADFTLKGSVKDEGTGAGVWKWTSSDDTVLGVTGNGATATVKILKAGSATITARYESDTTVGTEKTAKVTVNKAEPTIKAVPAGLTATYGQTLAEVQLYNPEGNDPGTWTWMNDAAVIGDVGELTFKAKFTPEDSVNYRVVKNIDVKVTAGKAPNPATVIYYVFVKNNGFSIDLEEYIIRNGATGQASFAFVDENDTKGCALENSYLASGNQMGTVPIKVSIAEDDHYEALTEGRMLVSVSDKGKQTITAKDVTTTYGATDAKVTAMTDGDGAISYSAGAGNDVVDVDAKTGALTAKKAGTATVVVTAEETDTYMGATRRVTVTVKKAKSVAASVSANNRGYDGTEKPLVTVTGEPTGGKMQYVLGTDAATAPTTGWSRD